MAAMSRMLNNDLHAIVIPPLVRLRFVSDAEHRHTSLLERLNLMARRFVLEERAHIIQRNPTAFGRDATCRGQGLGEVRTLERHRPQLPPLVSNRTRSSAESLRRYRLSPDTSPFSSTWLKLGV